MARAWHSLGLQRIRVSGERSAESAGDKRGQRDRGLRSKEELNSFQNMENRGERDQLRYH